MLDHFSLVVSPSITLLSIVGVTGEVGLEEIWIANYSQHLISWQVIINTWRNLLTAWGIYELFQRRARIVYYRKLHKVCVLEERGRYFFE